MSTSGSTGRSRRYIPTTPSYLPESDATARQGRLNESDYVPPTMNLNGYKDKGDAYSKSFGDSLPLRIAKRNWPLLAIVVWLLLSVHPTYNYYFSAPSARAIQHPSSSSTARSSTASSAADVASDPTRSVDAVDIFDNFKKTDDCSFSSLDLHQPFSPLCQDRDSLLAAMSGGGRHGFNQPYAPVGCDMRFFSPDEICSILSRFDTVYIIGDSMIRNVALGMMTFLRKSLYDGASVTWLQPEDGRRCRCEDAWTDRKCGFFTVLESGVVYENDPDSMHCPQDATANVRYSRIVEHPVSDSDVFEMLEKIPQEKPDKPFAFVFGHGLWNDLEPIKTKAWVKQIIGGIEEHATYLRDGQYNRLFLTPSAAGVLKPDIFITRQGNLAVQKFELAMGPWLREQGIPTLGTWNMTIQTDNWDGTHGGMRDNMMKAMMVLNWLNTIDTSRH